MNGLFVKLNEPLNGHFWGGPLGTPLGGPLGGRKWAPNWSPFGTPNRSHLGTLFETILGPHEPLQI